MTREPHIEWVAYPRQDDPELFLGVLYVNDQEVSDDMTLDEARTYAADRGVELVRR